MSALEDQLLLQLRLMGIAEPVREYRFHPSRKWRADFAYPDKKLLIEAEGATWARGRHTRGSGYEADCEKYNTAALLGYRVLRFTGGMIESGQAVNFIKLALEV